MKVDYELSEILEKLGQLNVDRDTAIMRIKALFPAQGVCADCDYLNVVDYNKCWCDKLDDSVPQYLGHVDNGCHLFKPRESE